tara:strand:- start:1166 stop:1330 length:165 start_codon:yes stop_codon:yes gene_type:complete
MANSKQKNVKAKHRKMKSRKNTQRRNSLENAKKSTLRKLVNAGIQVPSKMMEKI